MKLTKRISTIAVTGVFALSLAACSGDGDTDTAPTNEGSSTTAPANPDDANTGGDDMGEDMGEDTGDSMDPASQVFGPGCEAVPMDGKGSFAGMVQDPVATAASNNPLLSTLVTAVGEAGLVDTLNSAEELTVFAPTNDAFGKVDKKALDGLLKDKKALTTVLTHHVVAGKIAPEDLAGEHETLAGDTIKVEGSGEDFTIGEASIICGNVPTANATVYIVDSVLMPAM